MKHLVYGNGESRPRTSIGGDIISWGCNAIYRDFRVDNLVSIDYNIQQEIYESEYALTNKCWFSDWSVLPYFDTSIIKSISVRDNNPVYETKQFDRNSCVVQGTTIDSVQRVMDEILAFNPQLDKDDLRKKLEQALTVTDGFGRDARSIMNTLGNIKDPQQVTDTLKENPEKIKVLK